MITTIDEGFAALLSVPDRLRLVEPAIYSILSPDAPAQPYDRRSRLYDAVVGSDLYNRTMWGVDRRNYGAFAAGAAAADSTGWHLDAGCGSLVFTHEIYRAASPRPRVLVDKSLGMLRAARARLSSAGSAAAERTILLQADLLELPFRPQAFTTVLSMGMLHLFRDPAALVQDLANIVAPGGSLWLTSLVRGRPWGDQYLQLLHLAGEVAAPRSAAEVQSLLTSKTGWPAVICQEGNMLFVRLRASDVNYRGEVAGRAKILTAR
jgi:SAM-dependent methyltransferase